MDVEIVEEPSKGFLGLGARNAVVRLSVRKPAEALPQTPLRSGVGVQDGELYLTPPDVSTETVPEIRFGSEFQVLYQGEPVTGEIKLTHGLEPLEVRLPDNRQPELHYEIVVDAKKTKAELVWNRIPGVKHSLSNQPLSHPLTLRLTKTQLTPPTLTVKDVEELVRVEGLTYGLQLHGLSDELLSASKGSYVIAVGREPQPSRQPSIEYVFKESGVDIDEALRIDHYEVHGTEGVHEGAVLAIKDPGQLGEPGIDVYGQPIDAEPLKKVEIVVGEGVRLSDDGLQAIAATSGLPSLQGGVIRVTSLFELPGDADVSTGNITMDGDIIIRGSVLENVRVQSQKGGIVVHGLVSGGTLRSGGSITVLRNALRAHIHAGGVSVRQMRVLNLLRSISAQLEALEVAYDAIVSQADNVPFENLIRHLIELKFSSLPTDVKSLTEELGQIRDDSTDDTEQYEALIRTMDEHLMAGSGGILRIEGTNELRQFRQTLRERIGELEGQTTVEANVEVGYLQNSHVEASGTVGVTGKGCFYSTVLAGKGFRIAGGVFRGGQVTVNSGSIVAKELGGPTGIATTAQILRTGNISAALVHPNVTAVIGSQSYRFSDTASMVKVYFHDNILTVYSGSNKIHG